MSSYVGIHIRDQSLQSQLMQVELCSLESKFNSLKNQNGKVMAGDLPPLMVKLKAFREMYSEEEIRDILSGLDSDFSDEIDLNPSLREYLYILIHCNKCQDQDCELYTKDAKYHCKRCGYGFGFHHVNICRYGPGYWKGRNS